MTKARVLIVLCFILAFAAGISGGLAVSRPPERRPGPPFLVEELDLTPGQAEQIRGIWSKTREVLRSRTRGRRDALEQEREDAVRALLTPEQLARYEQVQADYRKKREEMGAKVREAIDQAVAETRKILTDEQRAKYEKLLEERRKKGGRPWGRGHHRGPHGSGPGGPPEPPPM